jgi:hypothetical protein
MYIYSNVYLGYFILDYIFYTNSADDFILKLDISLRFEVYIKTLSFSSVKHDDDY